MLETTDRVASNLVTSDTLAEFTAQKLGLVEAAPVAEETSEPEPQVSEEVTDEPKEKKPNPKLERRFSDLTKQREQARAEAQREREAREALETRLKELESKANPAPQDTNQEPQPEQFADMYEYAKALAEYTADKRLDERDREEKARKAAAEQEGKFKAWADRVNAAKNDLPDFEDMVQSSDVRISDPVRDAIIESEHGPKILYYLAENNEYAKKLSEMSVVSAVREIGKIEARFERTKPESKSVNVSKAPAPISPIRGAVNTVDANVDANGVFHGTYQQWKAARQAKRIR